MTPKLWIVIAAAGQGTRLRNAAHDLPNAQSGIAKQYWCVAGKPLLQWSLEAMLALPAAAVTLAVAADDQRFSEIVGRVEGYERVSSTVGGAERCDSVRAALRALHSQAAADDWVMVHDVARPCVRVEDCRRLMQATAAHGVGGLLAMPVVETVKRARANTGPHESAEVSESVPREHLWLAQTPQLFRFGLLQSALQSAGDAGVAVTDEASAVERLGHSPLLVRGHRDNLKVTWPEDLESARLILERRR